MTEWQMIAPDSLDDRHLLVTAVRCVAENEGYAACCRDPINAASALTIRHGRAGRTLGGSRQGEPRGSGQDNGRGKRRPDRAAAAAHGGNLKTIAGMSNSGCAYFSQGNGRRRHAACRPHAIGSRSRTRHSMIALAHSIIGRGGHRHAVVRRHAQHAWHHRRGRDGLGSSAQKKRKRHENGQKPSGSIQLQHECKVSMP